MKKFFYHLQSNKLKITLYSAVLIFIFLIHLTFIPNGFTWLDHRDIEQKAAIRPVNTLVTAFVEPYGQTGFYRPLVTILHSFDNAIYQNRAWGFHLTNLLLFMIILVILPLFLNMFIRLTLSENVLAILFVGTHPYHLLPVGSISYRPELLVVIGTMLSIIFYVKVRNSGNVILAILFQIILFATFLTKETALFIIPLVLVLWELTKQKKQRPNPNLPLFIPTFILLLTYSILRFSVIPEMWRVSEFTNNFDLLIGTKIQSLHTIISGFLSPAQPSLSDAVPLTHILSMSTLLLLISLCISLFIVIKTGITSSISKAILLLWILLIPAYIFIPVPRLGSPHYGFLPLLVIPLIIILFMRYAYKLRKSLIGVFYLILIFWIFVVTTQTTHYGGRFKNDLTLFAPEVTRDNHFLEGYFYLGNYYAQNHEYDRAKQAYYASLNTNTSFTAYFDKEAALVNLAQIALIQKNNKEASSLLKKLLPRSNKLQNQKLESFIEQLQK